MTPEERMKINRKLARFMGWTEHKDGYWFKWITPYRQVSGPVREYTDSLDLMAEVEAKLDEKLLTKSYVYRINEINPINLSGNFEDVVAKILEIPADVRARAAALVLEEKS